MAAVDVLSQQMAAKATLDYICEPRLGAASGLEADHAVALVWMQALLTLRPGNVHANAWRVAMQSTGPWVASRGPWWW